MGRLAADSGTEKKKHKGANVGAYSGVVAERYLVARAGSLSTLAIGEIAVKFCKELAKP